jgi:hypothetical protein
VLAFESLNFAILLRFKRSMKSSPARPAHRLFGVLAAFLLHVPAGEVSSALSDVVVPVNDNFASRPTVSGAPTTFTGTLVGATIEPGESFGYDRSIWWSWTAPESGLVLVQFDPRSSISGMISISTGTNLQTVGLSENLVAETHFSELRYVNFMRFEVRAGMTYQIGAFGTDSGPDGLSFVLTYADCPAILKHPATQTVTPGGCALLAVAALAHPTASNRFQWQFEGNDISGETRPLLALTNVLHSNAGEYRVLVSGPNSFGAAITRTSLVARLVVKQPAQPSLEVSRDPELSGRVLVKLMGEPGRAYWIRRQIHLGESAEGSLMPVAPSGFPWTFHLLTGLFQNGSQEFASASLFVPASPLCNLNLKQMHLAKELYAADTRKRLGDATRIHDLRIYFTGQLLPHCPEGGIYSYGAVGTLPQCSLSGHFRENIEY